MRPRVREVLFGTFQTRRTVALHGLLTVDQSAQKGADVAPSRDGREIVEPPEQIGSSQRLQDTQRKGGAPDPSTRDGQSDGIGKRAALIRLIPGRSAAIAPDAQTLSLHVRKLGGIRLVL
jgi:hypothetical protein